MNTAGLGPLFYLNKVVVSTVEKAQLKFQILVQHDLNQTVVILFSP